jgi:hypothetical protein
MVDFGIALGGWADARQKQQQIDAQTAYQQALQQEAAARTATDQATLAQNQKQWGYQDQSRAAMSNLFSNVLKQYGDYQQGVDAHAAHMSTPDQPPAGPATSAASPLAMPSTGLTTTSAAPGGLTTPAPVQPSAPATGLGLGGMPPAAPPPVADHATNLQTKPGALVGFLAAQNPSSAKMNVQMQAAIAKMKVAMASNNPDAFFSAYGDLSKQQAASLITSTQSAFGQGFDAGNHYLAMMDPNTSQQIVRTGKTADGVPLVNLVRNGSVVGSSIPLQLAIKTALAEKTGQILNTPSDAQSAIMAFSQGQTKEAQTAQAAKDAALNAASERGLHAAQAGYYGAETNRANALAKQAGATIGGLTPAEYNTVAGGMEKYVTAGLASLGLDPTSPAAQKAAVALSSQYVNMLPPKLQAAWTAGAGAVDLTHIKEPGPTGMPASAGLKPPAMSTPSAPPPTINGLTPAPTLGQQFGGLVKKGEQAWANSQLQERTRQAAGFEHQWKSAGQYDQDEMNYLVDAVRQDPRLLKNLSPWMQSALTSYMKAQTGAR